MLPVVLLGSIFHQTGAELTVERWASGEFEAQGPADEGTWRPDGRTLLVLRPVGAGADVDLVDAVTRKSSLVVAADAMRDPATGQTFRPGSCELSAQALDEGPGTTRHVFELLLRYLTTNHPAK